MTYLPPCVGFDPLLFDATDIATHLQVRRICAGCPFTALCLERAVTIAREHSRHNKGARGPDGTWAGVLWRDGVVVDLPAARAKRDRRRTAICGTEGGYARHMRTLQEPACDECKRAHREYERGRVARRQAEASARASEVA